jgi:hypothetical protein
VSAHRRSAGPRAALIGAALAAIAALASGCSGGTAGSEAASTTTSAHRTTSTTTPPVGFWSKPLAVAPGSALSVVSCPSVGTCVIGSASGETYRLFFERSSPLGPAVPSPSPQGTAYLSCATATFCAAAPSVNQVAFLQGGHWQPPAAIAGAQGITAIDCTDPSFCMTIDGEGNSFAWDGRSWSGNLGAWGAANQVSCVSPIFCVAAEGGPSVWNGHTWTQPNSVDNRGQLNSVSCASTTFCVLVDSSGGVLTWNGVGFSAPVSIATEPPQTGTDTSGLTGVSCPTTTFCRAVDSLGRLFAWNGTQWSTGTLIDNGHALTSISCSTTSYCVAVDRAGNAYVSA